MVVVVLQCVSISSQHLVYFIVRQCYTSILFQLSWGKIEPLVYDIDTFGGSKRGEELRDAIHLNHS